MMGKKKVNQLHFSRGLKYEIRTWSHVSDRKNKSIKLDIYIFFLLDMSIVTFFGYSEHGQSGIIYVGKWRDRTLVKLKMRLVGRIWFLS